VVFELQGFVGVELSRLIILHPSQWDLKWLVPRNAGDESCLKCSFIATLNINPPVLDFLLESPGTKGTCIVCSSSYRAADGRPLFWRVPSHWDVRCLLYIMHVKPQLWLGRHAGYVGLICCTLVTSDLVPKQPT